LPVLLCELQGRSRREVARQLCLPEGTLSSRLAKARRLLARRLARYGPALAAGAPLTLPGETPAAVPAPLFDATVRAAAGVASAPAAALAEGMMRAMFLTRLKTAVAVLAVGLLASAGVLSRSALANRPSAPAPH